MMTYRLPAEWEKHESTWLSWPYNLDTWHHDSHIQAQISFLKFIKIIQKGETINLIVNDLETRDKVLNLASQQDISLHNTIFHYQETNDAWIRDYGPDFLIGDTTTKTLNWQYNAWGNKYPYTKDNKISQYISNQNPQFQSKNIDFVLEGGSFEANGNGLLITTESCLLHPTRNPKYTKAQIEKILKKEFYQDEIIWLKNGIAGDDTDGHIDDFARFISQNTILIASEKRKENINHPPITENINLLKKINQNRKNKLNIIEIPMPHNHIFFKEELLPASYLNFYICNHAVIVPIFNDPNDQVAINIIASQINRLVIGVNAREIIVGLGAFHCLSKHEINHKTIKRISTKTYPSTDGSLTQPYSKWG